jgi:isoleucyl-tRNA synthetase
LEQWPTAEKIDQRLIDEMSQLRQIVEQGHALRAKAGIKVRQPLGQAVVSQTLRIEFLDILKDEMNVKEISEDKELAKLPAEYLRMDENQIIALDSTITDELKEEGMLRDLVRAVNALRKTAKLVPSDEIIFHVEPETMAAKLVERYGSQFLKDIRAKAATPSMDGATETAELTLDGKTEKIGLTKV